jgi:Protein of unknown function (DUF2975)
METSRPMTRPYSAALPIAYVALRVLIVLNWLLGAGILALLLVLPHREWLIISLDLAGAPDAEKVIMGFRAIALLGLVTVPLNHLLFTRLIAMVETVRAGDPFVAANARRLQVIAWILLVLQLLSLVIGGIGTAISTPDRPVDLDAGFSVNGWLAVLLTFILARIFAEGALMRDDLEGTV